MTSRSRSRRPDKTLTISGQQSVATREPAPAAGRSRYHPSLPPPLPAPPAGTGAASLLATPSIRSPSRDYPKYSDRFRRSAGRRQNCFPARRSCSALYCIQMACGADCAHCGSDEYCCQNAARAGPQAGAGPRGERRGPSIGTNGSNIVNSSTDDGATFQCPQYLPST